MITASYSVDDLLRMRDYLEEHYLIADWTKKYFDAFMRRSKELRSYLQSLLSEDEDVFLQKETLLIIIEKLFAAQGMGYITESFNVVGEDTWTMEKIKFLAPSITDEEIDILLEPAYDSFLQEYLRAVKKKSHEEIKRDWYWIKTSYIACDELSDDLIGEDRQRDAYTHQTDKERVLKKYDKNLTLFIEFIDYFVKMQDERKENVLRVNYVLHKLLGLLAKKSGLDKELLLACTPHEVLSVLDGNALDTTLLERRKKRSVFLCTRSAFEVTSEKEVLDRVLPILLTISKTVKGFCANKGLVRGPARVVFSEAEFGKVKQGDVLVTSMTRPEFLPVMEKACAFVTDEGGVTCHAAIIAREMKKPCIIGTRDATQLIKDGDFVEVDANTGVVKLIN